MRTSLARKGFLPLVRLIWIWSHGMPTAVCTALRCISLLTSALFWSTENLNLRSTVHTHRHSTAHTLPTSAGVLPPVCRGC